MQLNREELVDAAIVWLRQPGQPSIIGGYIDPRHDRDEHIQSYAEWLVHVFFEVIDVAGVT